MSCETNYAKLQKKLPAELEEPKSTGYGNLNLLLRIRAANFWHESLVTLSEAQLRNYCKQTIDFQYPNLKVNNRDLYNLLTFVVEPNMHEIYNYQWWLCYVTGPQSCTRDIAYINNLLDLPVNEEWSALLEHTLIEYQTNEPNVEQITGYACAETYKRLRLQK